MRRFALHVFVFHQMIHYLNLAMVFIDSSSPHQPFFCCAHIRLLLDGPLDVESVRNDLARPYTHLYQQQQERE